jgi:hypothetical protein
MKPTVDNTLAKYNIRPYNGSWYVQEKKLREVLEQVIEEAYAEGYADSDCEQFVNFGERNK